MSTNRIALRKRLVDWPVRFTQNGVVQSFMHSDFSCLHWYGDWKNTPADVLDLYNFRPQELAAYELVGKKLHVQFKNGCSWLFQLL